PADVPALLISNAETVISAAESGEIAHRPRGLQGLLVKGDGTVVTVVLDVDRRDVLEDSCLCSGEAGRRLATELESSLGHQECPAVLLEVQSAGLPVHALDCQPRIRVCLEKSLRTMQMLESLI